MMRILAVPLAFALALTSCLETTPGDSTIEAVIRPLDQRDPTRTALGEVEVLGIVELRSPAKGFGGLSGMAIQGDQVTAISDEGQWARFTLSTDRQGRPTGVSNLFMGRLGGLDGGKADSDSEELVATPEGMVVSFERRHRLLLYPEGLSGSPKSLALPEGFASQPDNGGVEAVTLLSDGRLLAISEEGGEGDLGWAWLGGPEVWQKLSYRRHGLFHPTGAATLPNGDVLVTERRFTLVGGPALRLVRIAKNDIRSGAMLDGHELFMLEPPLVVDNYESIAVRQRPDGRVVAYIVSDDNFNPMQSTLLMAVLLPL